ncbi:MAG TPA: hypothetical protein VHA79_15355 [Mycobacteriales bacterium]|jgi:hypothetical protein|nr:hypothetical protein [Mycobacteriales bacterium]
MTLQQLLDSQDQVLTRLQALEHLSDGALQHRLKRSWRILLPGVYLAATGEPTARQRLRAGLLYAGPDSQLADHTALTVYGVRYLPRDSTTYLLIPAENRRMSRDGAVIRRSSRLAAPWQREGLPYSPPARALADFVARIGNDRTALAVVADAIQRRITSTDEVVDELSHITGRGCALARRITQRISSGARSVPEADFLDLCAKSKVLPRPMVNALLELPDGRRISPDALWPDAALIHETNGRSAHAATDLFEDMQERHGAVTAAGFTALHSSPYQLRTEGDRILAQLESCYLRDQHKGLPPGVTLLRRSA